MCNDGSPGGYYFRKGADGSTLWVVYLEGGMWCAPFARAVRPRVRRDGGTCARRTDPCCRVMRRCYSEDTCQQRSAMTPWEMSSTKLAPSVALGGAYAARRMDPHARAWRCSALTRRDNCSNMGRNTKNVAYRAGIFETSAKNPWADANVAYLPYCSSDAWVGDIGASNVRSTPPQLCGRSALSSRARG